MSAPAGHVSGTLFVADARDYLTDKEMRTASQWNPE